MQPHTSAGRIPTDKGFRSFVDALVRVREVQPRDQLALIERLSRLRPGVDDLPREAGRVLSDLTGTAAVVHTPRTEDQHVAQLRWIKLRKGQLLAVLVTRSGAVENRVVHVENEPDAQELERLHNYLESLIGSRTLAELRAVVASTAERERSSVATRAFSIVEATLSAGTPSREVVIEGQQRLLERPDFASVDKIRSVLSVLDERERLLVLLDRTLAAGGIQVLIGAESELSETQNLSLISASFGPNGSGSGTLGLIGPTRIDYQKVVPLVSCAANLLTHLLDRQN